MSYAIRGDSFIPPIIQVGRRTWLSKQRLDSDIDIVVGYSPDADFFDDVCGNFSGTTAQKKTLDVKVDVIAVT